MKMVGGDSTSKVIVPCFAPLSATFVCVYSVKDPRVVKTMLVQEPENGSSIMVVLLTFLLGERPGFRYAISRSCVDQTI